MQWAAAKQVSDRAGDHQVAGASNFATLNVGGSATTVVSFVVATATDTDSEPDRPTSTPPAALLAHRVRVRRVPR